MAETSDDELLQIDNSIDTWPLKMTTASDFQRLRNSILTNLQKIKSYTEDLEKLVQKLGTPEDSEPLRDRYLRLQNDTKALMQRINLDLQQLQKTPVNEADQRNKKSLTEDLPKQYLAILNRFQEAQRIGARKERESLERARGVSYQTNGHGSQVADNMTPSNGQYQQQVVLPMEQQVDARALRERGEQLRELETNIVQVNELFKDVSRIVNEHGDIIVSISEHIDTTVENVAVANKKLGDAVTYQTAARRKKIMIISILVILIVILALVLIIYFSTKQK